MTPINRSDVQGLVAFGYGKLTEAVYLLASVRDAAAARAWIGAAQAATAERKGSPPDRALQIAFTAGGLRSLGVPEALLAGFSAEFIGGMAGDASRSRRLGDIGRSDPADWLWGGPDRDPEVLVMLFAKAGVEQWRESVEDQAWNAAFETVARLAASDMGGKEPFGFADGISQPEIDWQRRRVTGGDEIDYGNLVAAGEFLLGYPNEYGKYTDRPLLDPVLDATGELPGAEDAPAKKDFGRDGTFLVMRQLDQDVRAFWQYLDREAGGSAEERDRLGAAMVGRTRAGEPLIPAAGNNFTYDGDPRGVACPFGAHIRRANPRNADFVGRPTGPLSKTASKLGLPRAAFPSDLMASTRFHRILRRGREYGQWLAPEDALRPAPPNEAPRGLYFACLGANIARQFEFVQNAWLMSAKFNGLTDESDPLLGNRAPVGDCPYTGNFSIPRQSGLRRILSNAPQFIVVRGGAYFFLPGLAALRYLARGSYLRHG